MISITDDFTKILEGTNQDKVHMATNICILSKLQSPLCFKIKVTDEAETQKLEISAYKTNFNEILTGSIDGLNLRMYIDKNGLEDVAIDEKPIASLEGRFDDTQLTVDTINVQDDYVRQGIGSYILRTAEDLTYAKKLFKIYVNNHGLNPNLKFKSNKSFIHGIKDHITNKDPLKGAFEAFNAFLGSNGYHTEDTPYYMPSKVAHNKGILQPETTEALINKGSMGLQVSNKNFDMNTLLNKTNSNL